MRALHILALVIFSTSLHAQVRTWVSATGLDSNDCSRSSPCRNFSAAINAVNAGGEVVVLDSGGYGPVNIVKPVALIAPEGLHAGISPTANDAIVVNVPGGSVRLSNLTLSSQGSGLTGIRILIADQVLIEQCAARGFQYGLYITPADVSVNSTVRDSTFRDGTDGIRIYADTGQTVGLVVEDTLLLNNLQYGMMVDANGSGIIRISARTVTSARNAQQFRFYAIGSPIIRAVLESCTVVGKLPTLSVGIAVQTELLANAHVYVSNSTITGNAEAVRTVGTDSFVLGRGNNSVVGNGCCESFSGSFPVD